METQDPSGLPIDYITRLPQVSTRPIWDYSTLSAMLSRPHLPKRELCWSHRCLRDVQSASGRIDDWASIRTAEFQYTEWYQEGTDTVIFREYYDMVNDPWQLDNVYQTGAPADHPDHTAWSAQLTANRSCAGSSCSLTLDP